MRKDKSTTILLAAMLALSGAAETPDDGVKQADSFPSKLPLPPRDLRRASDAPAIGVALATPLKGSIKGPVRGPKGVFDGWRHD